MSASMKVWGISALVLHGAIGCAFALGYPTASSEVCDNGIDDDLDGALDCADLQCAGVAACVEVCDNEIDDDEDDLVDCVDPQCDGACVEQDGLCFDGRDNDLDGQLDWRDPRCWDVAASVTVDDCGSERD